jgi:hypothetical protein
VLIGAWLSPHEPPPADLSDTVRLANTVAAVLDRHEHADDLRLDGVATPARTHRLGVVAMPVRLVETTHRRQPGVGVVGVRCGGHPDRPVLVDVVSAWPGVTVADCNGALEAGQLAVAIGAEVLVPMHSDTGDTGDVGELTRVAQLISALQWHCRRATVRCSSWLVEGDQ